MWRIVEVRTDKEKKEDEDSNHFSQENCDAGLMDRVFNPYEQLLRKGDHAFKMTLIRRHPAHDGNFCPPLFEIYTTHDFDYTKEEKTAQVFNSLPLQILAKAKYKFDVVDANPKYDIEKEGELIYEVKANDQTDNKPSRIMFIKHKPEEPIKTVSTGSTTSALNAEKEPEKEVTGVPTS